MNTFYLALFAYVSANFLEEEGVREGIMYAAGMVADFHATNEPQDDASKVARSLMMQYAAAPPISSFVDDVVNQFIAGRLSPRNMNPSQAIQLMKEYKGAFTAFEAEPEFAKFKDAVEKALPKFDTKAMIADGQSMIKQYAPQGKAMYSSFVAAPSGKAAISSAKELYDLHNKVFDLGLPPFSKLLNLL